MQVYLGGRRIHLDPARSIGKGGEADVYEIGGGLALKLFKPPEHPDYAGHPDEQEAARERIAQHQRKLREFPAGLPERVLAPQELATDRRKQVVGYSMRLLAQAEPLYRYGTDRAFYQPQQVAARFLDLHRTLTALHAAGVVVGDLNGCNVLVTPAGEPYLIDADSLQFGPYPCRVFTARYVDPLLCDPQAPAPVLVRPYTPDSDWYAYQVLLFQCLLLVDPFGGVHAPRDPTRKVPAAARPLRGITVLDPEVRYPKPAVPYGVLPDDLLHRFHRVLAAGERGPFPRRLLEQLRWSRCPGCGTVHARSSCPQCAVTRPVPAVTAKGAVRCTTLFRTRGAILAAALTGGRLRWLYHEEGVYRREDGQPVLHGELDPHLHVGLLPEATLLGKGARLVRLAAGAAAGQIPVDACGNDPVFAVNGQQLYWAQGSQLLREGPVAPVYLGDVLPGQTRIWAGPRFGFGFYRAGSLQAGFVFDAARPRSLSDKVPLPPIRGRLLEATCCFDAARCWFLYAAEENGRTVNHCLAITPTGAVEAAAQAPAGDGSWLGSLHGQCAVNGCLLSPTDEGVVRVETAGGGLVVTRRYPETEPFVHAGCRLFPDPQGLAVADRQEIRLLQMAL